MVPPRFVDTARGIAVGVCNYAHIQPADRLDRDRGPGVQPAPAAPAGGDRGDVSDDAPRFRRAGYRRYVWKCDALNLPSRAAAGAVRVSVRGAVRQATITKGRNANTAWFSILDGEWPKLRAAFRAWLDPANFDADGQQRRALASFR